MYITEQLALLGQPGRPNPAQTASGNHGGVTIAEYYNGGGLASNIHVTELLLYGVNHTSEQADEVFDYLNDKFAVY
jgi:hypothetical protein